MIRANAEIDRVVAFVTHNANTAKGQVGGWTLKEWQDAGNCGICHRETAGLCRHFECAPKHLEGKTLTELFGVPHHGEVLARSFGRWINDGRLAPRRN